MLSLLANWTTDMWAPIIGIFSFIPNYAWSIIVFTIALKIILSPLDFWQRKVQRDSLKKQQEMQPLVEKLQKQYGNNKQVLNQKTMDLYKKHNYNVVGSCVSMLINFVLTIFIFFTLFYGLTGMAQNKVYEQYKDLETTFYTSYSESFGVENDKDKVWEHYTGLLNAEETNARAQLAEEGITEPTADQLFAKEQEIVLNHNETIKSILSDEATYYNTIKDGWLWIDSIWRPDTYASGFPDYKTYFSSAAITSRAEYEEIKDKTQEEKDAIIAQWEKEYNLITNTIQQEHKNWNGYFILVILAALITYLSISFSQRTSLKKQKGMAQGQQNPQGSMKIMKFLMPLIMVFFTLSYSAAFAVYIVTNQIMSFAISIIALAIFSKKDDQNNLIIKPKKVDVEYSR